MNPWSRADAIRSGALALAGATVVVAGWYQASDRSMPSQQAGPAVVGVAGGLLAIAALVTWVAAGRRAIQRRTHHLLGEGTTGREVLVTAIAESADLVAGPRLRRYHRADCPLAAGKGWRARPRSAHTRAGRLPCGVCRP